MYYLDTNALYIYYGREKLNLFPIGKVDVQRFRTDLDRKDIALSASAFIEAIVHFRNNTDLLLGLLSFIKDKRIRLYNNVAHYCFDETQYSLVLNLEKLCLKQYAQKLLDKKIDIEMRFISAFLQIMIVLYANYRLRMEDISDPSYSNLLNYIGRQDYSKTLEKITSDLKTGYNINNEERILKNSYLEALEENCVFVNILIKTVQKCNNPSADLIAEIQNVYRKYEADKTAYLQESKQDNFLMGHLKDELSKDSDFLKMAKPKIAEMFSDLPKDSSNKFFCLEQSKYIETVMFDAWIDRAKKIEKNDIFDMLFIGCFKGRKKPACVLEDTSPYLISFDKKIINYLKSEKPSNGALIETFYL